MRREPAQEDGMPVTCGVCVCSEMALLPTKGSHPPEVQETLSWCMTSDFPSQALLLQSLLTLYGGVCHGLVETCTVWPLNFFSSPTSSFGLIGQSLALPSVGRKGILITSASCSILASTITEASSCLNPRRPFSFPAPYHIPIAERKSWCAWVGVRG